MSNGKLEIKLFEAGWGINGKPFSRLFFYRMFTNPWFWGDAVRNHRNPHAPNKERVELWLVDPSAPVPKGVMIRRNVNPPALTGDLALQLRAEVIRRITTNPRNHNMSHIFTGLLVCQRCGYTMQYSSNGAYAGYYCASKYVSRHKYDPANRPGCEKLWWVSELYTKDWMTAALKLMLEENNPFGLVAAGDDSVLNNTRADFENQLKTVEKQIQRLIEKQSAAPESLADIYDKQIEGLATQRENLLHRLDEVERDAKRYNTADIQAAFRELTTYETLDAFWAADNGVINQLLHRLMGNRRLVVLDRKITGSIEWSR